MNNNDNRASLADAQDTPFFRRSIKLALLSVAVIGVIIGIVQSASAYERTGKTEIEFSGRKLTHTFTGKFDPATGDFQRNGSFTTQAGKAAEYNVTGHCNKPDKTCDFKGTATGPFGGKWKSSGHLVRNGQTITIEATATSPSGQTIKINRSVSGDALPEFNK